MIRSMRTKSPSVAMKACKTYAGGVVLLAALLIVPGFATQAATTTTTTTTTTSPSVQTYDDAGTVMTSHAAKSHTVHHMHHKHHPMVVKKTTDSTMAYASTPAYDDIAMRRRQLWHEHYVIEAERQSLKIACMNVKGQDRSDCNEKWEDVRAQQDRLMAEVAALDKRTAMPMHQPRECMATPGHAPMAHCGMLPHDRMMSDDGYDHVAVMTPLPRPSAIAVPPITTPNAVIGQE